VNEDKRYEKATGLVQEFQQLTGADLLSISLWCNLKIEDVYFLLNEGMISNPNKKRLIDRLTKKIQEGRNFLATNQTEFPELSSEFALEELSRMYNSQPITKIGLSTQIKYISLEDEKMNLLFQKLTSMKVKTIQQFLLYPLQQSKLTYDLQFELFQLKRYLFDLMKTQYNSDIENPCPNEKENYGSINESIVLQNFQNTIEQLDLENQTKKLQ